jgi:serine/threonine protein kinase
MEVPGPFPMTSHSPLERLGTVLAGRYRLDRILAVGGMSVVYEGHDARRGAPVAIKLQKRGELSDRVRNTRFVEEAKVTMLLRHPHVVEAFSFGEDDAGTPYLVMELLRGESLESFLAKRGTVGVATALELLLPVLGALAHVHDSGIVHRDVKPDNVFLVRTPVGDIVPKLLDFGIAKGADSALLTREGAVLGTPQYMAPEQRAGYAATPATDVWAAGAMFHRCALGEPPPEGGVARRLAARIMGRGQRLDARGLPPGFGAAIERALARDVSRRYTSMHEFAAALVLTARDAGIHVANSLVASAGLENEDWMAEGAGQTRTLSSTSIVSAPRARWAAPGVTLCGVMLVGWIAGRQSGTASPPAPSAVAPAPVASGAPRGSPVPLPLSASIPAAAPSEAVPERANPPIPVPPAPVATPRARKPARAPKAQPPAPSEIAPAADELPVVTRW